MNNKIYLAGPDVFRHDVVSYFNEIKQYALIYEMEAISPFDCGKLPNDCSPSELARVIYNSNIKIINDCSFFVCNMNPFRGPSMDVGTAFELGYAKASNKIIVGYIDEWKKYSQKVQPDEFMIEEFELFDNLMVVISTPIVLTTIYQAIVACRGIYEIRE